MMSLSDIDETTTGAELIRRFPKVKPTACAPR